VLNHSRCPVVGPLHEGMWFATASHFEVAMWLGALWVAVSSSAESVLGRFPVRSSRRML
jgi:hypothetical protein